MKNVTEKVSDWQVGNNGVRHVRCELLEFEVTSRKI